MKPISKLERKDDKIQLLRGLAIISVVIIHTYPIGIFGVFLRPFVNYAVALFIFLSGYLTKIDIPNYKPLIFKRVKKVVVPYLLWSVIYMIPQGFTNFGFNLLTGQTCGTFYYVFVYVQFVLLTPLIAKLIKSKYRWVGWFITPVFTVAVKYILHLGGYASVGAYYNYWFVAWFIFYYLGMVLGNNVLEIKKNNTLNAVMYAAAILLSCGEGFLWYNLNDINMTTSQLRLTSLATSLTAILIAYQYIRSNKKTGGGIVSRVLLVLGNTSFGIFLSHILIKNILESMPIWKYAVFPINTVVVLAISAICVLIGKKVLRNASWILGL